MANPFLEFTIMYPRQDTSKVDTRLFQVGERYYAEGPPVLVTEACGCGVNNIKTVMYYTIKIGNLTYTIDGQYVKELPAVPQPQEIHEHIADRLANIGRMPMDPFGNPGVLVGDNYRPNAEQKRWEDLGTFDLRRKKG